MMNTINIAMASTVSKSPRIKFFMKNSTTLNRDMEKVNNLNKYFYYLLKFLLQNRLTKADDYCKYSCQNILVKIFLSK